MAYSNDGKRSTRYPSNGPSLQMQRQLIEGTLDPVVYTQHMKKQSNRSDVVVPRTKRAYSVTSSD